MIGLFDNRTQVNRTVLIHSVVLHGIRQKIIEKLNALNDNTRRTSVCRTLKYVERFATHSADPFRGALDFSAVTPGRNTAYFPRISEPPAVRY